MAGGAHSSAVAPKALFGGDERGGESAAAAARSAVASADAPSRDPRGVGGVGGGVALEPPHLAGDCVAPRSPASLMGVAGVDAPTRAESRVHGEVRTRANSRDV